MPVDCILDSKSKSACFIVTVSFSFANKGIKIMIKQKKSCFSVFIRFLVLYLT